MEYKTALYIGADPMTFNDESLIRTCIEAFGFINILLDRRNRDAEYEQYSLNFADRSDIIKHDLKDVSDRFQIIPIDITVQQAISDNGIRNLVLNLDYQKETNFRTQRVLRQILKNVNVFCLQGERFIGSNFMKTLVNSDSSMKMYKEFCSDYSYAKYKVKTMTKIGITGNMGSRMDVLVDVLKDKKINVIDLDEYTFNLYENREFIDELSGKYRAAGITGLKSFIHAKNGKDIIDKCDILRFNMKNPEAEMIFQKILYQKIQQQIMNCMMSQFSDAIVIKFVLIYEYAMEKMFDRIITVACEKEKEIKNLIDEGYDLNQINCFFELEQDIEEKREYADFVIDSNGDETDMRNESINLLNSKFKKILRL